MKVFRDDKVYVQIKDLAILFKSGGVLIPQSVFKKALKKALKSKGTNIYNLGTGHGYSVLDLINTFEKVNGIKVKYKIAPRRPGDIASCYADASKAKKELGWEATHGIEDMCRDAYNFVKKHK